MNKESKVTKIMIRNAVIYANEKIVFIFQKITSSFFRQNPVCNRKQLERPIQTINFSAGLLNIAVKKAIQGHDDE